MQNHILKTNECMIIPKSIINKSIKALENNTLSSVLKIQKEIDKRLKNFKNFKIGIVRTFTLETQISFVKLALSILPVKTELKLSDLNNIEQELLDSQSNILSWSPDIILILWRIEELIPNLVEDYYNFSNTNLLKLQKQLKLRISKLIKNYNKISDTPILISTLPISHLVNNDNYKEKISLQEFLEEINHHILQEIRKNKNVYLYDFNKWSNTVGKLFYDKKMDFYAKQPISLNYIGNFSLFLSKSLRPFIHTSAKAIAIDLDNVLWGGILGEDGIANLNIGYEFPGNIYRSIQTKIKSLKKKGFLIFLLSKNNSTDVINAFKNIEGMPLKLSDFDAVKINWKEKYKNLIELSNEFNIGLESFVFIDDQKFEQDQMKYNVKQVNTLHVDDDPINILNSIENCQYLDKIYHSNEDGLRNKDYKANIKRNKLKLEIKNKNSFLKLLNLKAKIIKLNKDNTNRAFDLINKTNQFNLRTNRISIKKIKELQNENKNISILISLSDKFGNQGIIGLIIGIYKKKNNTIFIDNFLLSCRAIGRGVENILFYELQQKSKKLGVGRIEAEYISTKKNEQVANLYDKFGFKLETKNKNRTSYSLKIPSNFKKPNWIKIIK